MCTVSVRDRETGREKGQLWPVTEEPGWPRRGVPCAFLRAEGTGKRLSCRKGGSEGPTTISRDTGCGALRAAFTLGKEKAPEGERGTLGDVRK